MGMMQANEVKNELSGFRACYLSSIEKWHVGGSQSLSLQSESSTSVDVDGNELLHHHGKHC